MVLILVLIYLFFFLNLTLIEIYLHLYGFCCFMMVVSWGSWFNSILKQIGINLYASNWIFLCEVSLNMYIFFLAAFMCVLCCGY